MVLFEEKQTDDFLMMSLSNSGWFLVSILLNIVSNMTVINDVKKQYPDVFCIKNMVTPTSYVAYMDLNVTTNLSTYSFIYVQEYQRTASDFSQNHNVLVDNYLVKACPSFPDGDHSFKIEKTVDDFYYAYSVFGSYELKSDPCVKSFRSIPTKNPQNRYVSGYMQNGENYLSYDKKGRLVVDRSLDKYGIDGSGQIVTILDTGIDAYHDFFYDPANPDPPVDETNLNHRKIVRIDALADAVDYDDGHGTHVCGIVAGESLENDSVSSYYNGIAYKSKLYVVDVARKSNFDSVFNEAVIIGQMEELGSGISSNSWGYAKEDTVMSNYYNSLAYNYDDILFVFAAGNSQKEMTIPTPADAKNILTVGMTSQPSIADIESKRTYSIGDGNTIINDIKIIANENLLHPESSPVTSYQNIKSKTVLYAGPNICMALNEGAKCTVFIYSGNDCDDAYYGNILVIKVPDGSIQLLNKMDDFSIYINTTLEEDIETNSYSSQGPTRSGITKPEIAAPGVSINSARGTSSSTYTGDTSKNVIRSSSGTSMSTPLIAGAAALVRQYFMDGKYHAEKKTPSAALMRAALINSAEPCDEGSYMQSYKSGFGIPVVDKALGYKKGIGANFLDNQNIGANGHRTFVLTTEYAENLSITLSYNDFPFNGNYIIYADLSLIIETPSGKTYHGNGLNKGADDQFTTNEKISISNAEKGKYIIHVYCNDYGDILKDIKFAIAVTGGFPTESDALVYDETLESQCPNECNGECYKGRCVCDVNYTGTLCQTHIDDIMFNQDVYTNSIPRKYRYYKIRKDDPNKMASFNVSIKADDSDALFHVCINDKVDDISSRYCNVFTSSTVYGTFFTNESRFIYIMVTIINQSPKNFHLYVNNSEAPKKNSSSIFDYDDIKIPTASPSITISEQKKEANTALILGTSISAFVVLIAVIVTIIWKVSTRIAIDGSLNNSYEYTEEDEEYSENVA